MYAARTLLAHPHGLTFSFLIAQKLGIWTAFTTVVAGRWRCHRRQSEKPVMSLELACLAGDEALFDPNFFQGSPPEGSLQHVAFTYAPV